VAEEKTLCVMGTFDAETEARFEAIKAKIRLSDCEVDEQPPHLTFGIYSGVSREEMVRFIEGVAEGLSKTQLFFGLVGVFPESEVLFAAPSVTQELLDMHAKLHARYDDFCFDKNCLYSLQGGKWIPHITLATPRDCQAQDMLAIILDEFTPFQGEITHLRITEQEPLVEVASFALS
jgi:2'-5' RNA ligase